MSLSSRAKRYLKVHGGRKTAAQAVRFLLRKGFSKQDPIIAHRRSLGVQLHKRFDGVVQAGPLKGFRMSDDLTWGAADRGSMLTGLYEANVVALLEAFSNEASTLIDIGAADGYFGVGAVASGLYSRSVCFERDPVTREALAQSARTNGVLEKVMIFGDADASFSMCLAGADVDLAKAVVLSDIEGGEFELFDDELLKSLSRCKIIIELHELMVPEGDQKLARFVASAKRHFDVTFLEGGARDPGALAVLRDMPDNDRWALCSEGRTVHQRWMVLVPSASDDPHLEP